MSFLSNIFEKVGKVAAPITGFLSGNPWIGTALGAGMDMFSSAKANSANRDIAREQMEFQERMSSTAYQRSRADAQAAGFNPILGYQQGGSSSPAGAGAHVEPVTARMAQNLALRSQQAQIDNISAQTESTRVNTDLDRKYGAIQRLTPAGAAGLAIGGASAKALSAWWQRRNMTPVEMMRRGLMK